MKQKSLIKRVNNIFWVSVGIPFVLVFLLHSVFIERLIFSNYRDTMSLTLQSMANHLDSNIDSCERFFLQYLFDENLERFYAYVNNHEINTEDEQSFYNYYKRASRYRNAAMKYMFAANSWLTAIYYVPENCNKDKIFRLRKAVNNVEILELEQSSYRLLVDALRDSPLGEILISGSPDEAEKKEEIFVLGRRINQVERIRRQGYLLLEVSGEMYREIAVNVDLEEPAGLVISYPDMRQAYSSSEEIRNGFEQIVDIEAVRAEESAFLDGKRCCLYSIQSEKGFFIDYLVPADTVMSRVWKLYGLLICVWIAAVAIAYLLYTRLFGTIRRTTTELMEMIENYQVDRDHYRPAYHPHSGIVEFDNIGRTLANMMDRIQIFVEEEYVLKMKQQAAEYKAMQAEINPHFLNNVLSSFVALNRMNEKKRLERAILKLSQMFWYTCEHGYDSRVDQECQFIESYLLLEKLRFEERLDYRISVEKEAGELEIPKLLLQPIVENAMKHGFVGNNSMTILLQASALWEKGKKFVWITVANNGRPISRKELEQSRGVGVANVKERLTLVYPDSFFWFSSTEKFPTICNILIMQKEQRVSVSALDEGEKNANIDSR